MIETWGDRLRLAISIRHINKTIVIAETLSLNESTVSRWVSGGNIRISHAVRLCDSFDISMDWLFRNVGDIDGAATTPFGGMAVARLSPESLSALDAFVASLQQPAGCVPRK
ncbi:MAG: helix-turn-helix domain-containing protein [Paracoccus sp. (in: a-proteobacteria)]